jgi:serine/threonine protein kinase
LIQGLDFLHQSPVGFHGSLNSSNCFIDSHWIVKLSNFGLGPSVLKWLETGKLAVEADSFTVSGLSSFIVLFITSFRYVASAT